ncbi:OLC1v1005751C1 [Oldenlandia corymbosa var. corymbosa]|uniref:OLC1v1005751C1 n=1 Tax=Oldenlandia corymbosa var. corymbosa TaxID=529605 RepID=A0AAV1DG04_OLDCO|nr:OLC1v1005751C1 [Oldenlandia corymbosa var. corymbosa]
MLGSRTISFLFLFATIFSAVHGCPPSDRAALLAFKAALSEPYIGIFNSWKGNDCCHGWYGVQCDPVHRRVADINLHGISEEPIFQKAHRTGYMTGKISPEICKLSWLSSLTVAEWKGISGSIPACITSLPFLRHIDLTGNKISGELPADIGRLSRLVLLHVADNQIAGQIPRSLTNLTSLAHLDLRNNLIQGTIPSDIGKMKKLSRALLSRNRLQGLIPDSFSAIYRLLVLDLSFNRLSGSIPASLGKMSVLATLNLDGNNLSGTMPASLISSRISSLNVSRNAIEGPIPDAFGPSSYFTVLDLSYNKLKGSLPKSIGSASYIGHLDVSHNHLCGRIPAGPPFDHLDSSSFFANDCLCGKPLKPCR